MNTVNWQEIKKDLLELIPKLKDFREDDEIKNYLENIKEIKVYENNTIISVPETIKYLKNLEVLIIKHYLTCNELRILPDSIGELANLRELHIISCEYLLCIPESIEYLQELRVLNLSENGNLSFLPDSIGKLKNLKVLNLRGCNQLKSLPESICELENLKELDLSGVDYDEMHTVY